MTKRIVVLPEEVANQIAAGEVVERPASIVKELVENSIDAGASDIRVELTRGGCDAVRIIDNGSGIEREDVSLVFERHATSKIRSLGDIYSTRSFGFRGEAMASIASIARVELLTRRPEDLAGTRALVQAGAIVEISPAGCRAGTQITVTDIFANVPARRKFLKTEATEQAACLDAVMRLALAHPGVRFSVRADGRDIFAAPIAPSVSDRVVLILGEDFKSHCREISGERGMVALSGYTSAPSYTRSNSKHIFLFVNSRFIRDSALTHALLSAYRQIIEPRRYPAAVLFLEVPGDEVDVNVHPAKLEVRFKKSAEVYELISHAVAQALVSGTKVSDASVYRLSPRATAAASGGWRPKTSYWTPRRSDDVISLKAMQQAIQEDLSARSPAQETESPSVAKEDPPAKTITFSGYVYLGQFAETYLVFAGGDGLMLIDQHAAHERVLLERLKAASASKVLGQSLLMPEIVTLSPAQVGLLEEALPMLREIGLDVEIFGRDAVVVKSMPASLPDLSPKETVLDLADQLADRPAQPSLVERREKILASLACRAAVKANASLCKEEVASLCRDLEQTPFHATCPHGRPVSIQFSLYEIERLFKRK